MITIYATFDTRLVMGKELFAPSGVLEKNRWKFSVRTQGHALIASEDTFIEFLDGKPLPDHPLFVVSERLFTQYQKPGDRYVERDGITIISEYRQALSLASEGRRHVTILGGHSLIEMAVRTQQSVHRLCLVRVSTKTQGSIYFPYPVIDFFDLVDEELLEQDARNPFPAVFQVYWRKH